MDPNVTLEQILILAKVLEKQYDRGDDIDRHDAGELAGLVMSLNHWIECGGFLPKSWKVEL